MLEIAKKWGVIVGLILGSLSLFGAIAAYGNSIIDTQVEKRLRILANEQDNPIDLRVRFHVAGVAKTDDLKSLERRLNGIQEQTTTSASDRRVIKEQLEGTRREQKQGFDNINQKFELLLRLYERKQ